MNFESFCAAATDIRDYLRTPFKVDGYAVASDGHRFICRPLDGELLPAPPSNVNKTLSELIAKCCSQAGFVSLPKFTLPEKRNCGICKGIGTVLVVECPECDGEGKIEAESPYNALCDLECKTCAGDGKEIQAGGSEQCPECDGDGKTWDKHAHVNVLGIKLDPRYLLAISDAPDLRIKPGLLRPRGIGEFEDGLLLFRSGDYKGAIMGMRIGVANPMRPPE